MDKMNTQKQTEAVSSAKRIGWLTVAAGTALFVWNVVTSDHGDAVTPVWFDWNLMYFLISFPIWLIGFGMVASRPRDLRSEALKNVEALEQEVAAADAASMAQIKVRAELVQKTLDNEYHKEKMSSTNWIELSARVLAVIAICDGHKES